MLGHLCQSISKRSSTDDVHSEPIWARHYSLCCCEKHNDILSKSGKICHVYDISCKGNRLVVDSRPCIHMHVFYILVINSYNKFYRYFCFQVILNDSIEFRKREIALLTLFIITRIKFMQFHELSFSQFKKHSLLIKPTHLKLTNHVHTLDLEDFSIGHCSCENDTFCLVKCWCEETSNALKCYWLNFSALALMLLVENIYRNFKIFLSLLPSMRTQTPERERKRKKHFK